MVSVRVVETVRAAARGVPVAPVVLAGAVIAAVLGGGGSAVPDTRTAPRVVPVAATAALPAALPAAVSTAAVSTAAPCRPAARACVRLSTNQAWLVRDGHVVAGPIHVSHGGPGQRTPPGTFHVSFKQRDHRSSLFHGAAMPWSVFFNGGIAFHQGNPARASAGCVHLPAAAAQTFYSALQPGDVVQVVA